MRILVNGLNFAPALVGIGPYSAGTVAALVAAGHDVRVIAGKPYYPDWGDDPAGGTDRADFDPRRRRPTIAA
ncbi:MAG TPA: hypothetical protein VF695_00195 [Sphingomonas sp.]|jgi:colanic acid biosynthesis glycosyl transferase WcaI